MDVSFIIVCFRDEDMIVLIKSIGLVLFQCSQNSVEFHLSLSMKKKEIANRIDFILKISTCILYDGKVTCLYGKNFRFKNKNKTIMAIMERTIININ